MPVVVSWRDRIGGPKAVSWVAWAWLLPWGVWTTVAFQPAWQIAETVGWTLVGVAAHGATGLTLLIAYWTYLRPGNRASRPWLAIVTFAVAGCVRGTTVGLLSVALSLSPLANLSFRVPAGALLTVVWFVIATVTVDTVRRHGETLATLSQRRAQLEISRQQTNEQLLHWRQQLVQEIRMALRAAFDCSSGDDTARPHERLRTIAEDVVRPLSHQVAHRPVAETASPPPAPAAATAPVGQSWLCHIRRAMLETPFPLVIPTVVTILTGAPVLLFATGSLFGLAVASTLGAIVCLLYWMAGALQRRIASRWPPIARLMITVIIWLWTAWAVARTLVSIDAVTVVAPNAFVAAAISVLGMTFVGSLLASFEQLRQQTIEQVGAIVDALHREGDYLRRRLEHERDRLVRLLHGSVHARITGLAIQLANTPTSRAEFDQLATALQQECLHELATQVAEPIEVRLDSICQVWRVVMQVGLHLEPTAQTRLDRDPVAADNVIEVVREALANAARHAQATRADVSVRVATNSRITVNVWDNGVSSPLDESPAGLGTKILNQCTTDWELVRGSGATLHAQVDVHARLEAIS